MDKDKRLMEASLLERLTEGVLSLVLMGRVMHSKSLIKFSVDGWGCIPTLLFDLRPNYGGGDGDNGDLLWKVPACNSTGDSWTLTGKSGSVSWVTAPFSWVLVCTRFCLCPPRVCFPSRV